MPMMQRKKFIRETFIEFKALKHRGTINIYNYQKSGLDIWVLKFSWKMGNIKTLLCLAILPHIKQTNNFLNVASNDFKLEACTIMERKH